MEINMKIVTVRCEFYAFLDVAEIRDHVTRTFDNK